ncbi:7337_t:CDS:2 [Dentiscutata heterogama]|uniref:7337_t:CDS:1 n=1 Tax=Dentiscutata heterogama TaxID=1316150 RepID=A0ACA9KNU9_9GLOM|nr:7337_t:CDS:2 [Dentiscutata heterogama]
MDTALEDTELLDPVDNLYDSYEEILIEIKSELFEDLEEINGEDIDIDYANNEG